jgi:hypothetical protein
MRIPGLSAIVGALLILQAGASSATPHAQPATLSDAQHLFYSGRYEAAAAAALLLQSSPEHALAAYELRTSALHFLMKRAMGSEPDKRRSFAKCDACPALLVQIRSDLAAGTTLARARVHANAQDEAARFFLGKLSLTDVWMQLGTLGRRSGWDQYWEARRSLDWVIKRNPQHIRARVARAWIDYIVDTKLPRGTKWLLGGGNRKRALLVIREAADAEAEPFTKAEANFSLWDIQQRERNIPGAVVTAQVLARAFPENQELVRFLNDHDPDSRRDQRTR